MCAGGFQLFHRQTGCNILVDDLVPSPGQWSLAPRYVSVALTNACDLSCSYCYAPKKSSRLDGECLRRWLLDLDANGCLGVGFGGGEPTLYPRFADVCRFATEETGMAVSFTTHAHHLGELILQRLAGYVNFVRVSMDGVAATYEATRGRSFAQLLSRIRAIRQIAPFGINYVVNSRTISDLDLAVEYGAKLGASEFLLLPERPTQNSCGANTDVHRRLREWVTTYSGNIPLAVSESFGASLPFFSPVPGEPELRGYAHVDAMGVIKASAFHETGITVTSSGIVSAFIELHKLSTGGGK